MVDDTIGDQRFFCLQPIGHITRSSSHVWINCWGGSENPSLTARDEPWVCNLILTKVGASDTTKSA